MHNFRYIAITIALFLNISVFAQMGGKNTFDFLELTNSARSAALGGKLISIQDNDLNLSFENPSLLNPSNDNQLLFNYVNYFSDINYGYVSYAKDISNIGTFAGGIQYLNYGTFVRADETGIKDGTFTAADYSFNILYSNKIDSMINFGANLKTIYSHLDSYTSFGMALDLGLNYFNPESQLLLTVVAKNIGKQFKPYVEDNYEPLPFDIQVGVSKKFAHAPFRFSIVAHHLQKFDLTFDNPQDPDLTPDPITGNVKSKSKFEKYGDMFLRHIIVGIEISPIKNFFLRFGYNHQRRMQMELFTSNGFSGISWGIGVKLYKFRFSYGNAVYHVAGSSHHFSITTNFSDWKKK